MSKSDKWRWAVFLAHHHCRQPRYIDQPRLARKTTLSKDPGLYLLDCGQTIHSRNRHAKIRPIAEYKCRLFGELSKSEK
jgi:hypothetical protein